MQFNNTILLLGAGFSKNFGGLLAREMWAKIFNHPLLDTAPDVKLALKNDFNYETLYSAMYNFTENGEKDQFKVLEKVLQEVYKSMNDKLLYPDATHGINISQLQNNFINKFTDDGSGGFGACFTLNQDLFFEKHFNRNPFGPTSIHYGNNTVNAANLNSEIELPAEEAIEVFKKQFNGSGFGFIKLHGSLNWITTGGDSAKVIGINKPEIISSIPLLKWYKELFTKAVQQENIKLVVYGYSFGDPYINQIIFDAIVGRPDRKASKMKIYIISPENPKALKERLEMEEHGEIWNAVDGYFPYLMKDLFPSNEQKTPQYEELMNRIGFTS